MRLGDDSTWTRAALSEEEITDAQRAVGRQYSKRDDNTPVPTDQAWHDLLGGLCKMAAEVANGSREFSLMLGVVGEGDTSSRVRTAAVYVVLEYIQHGGEVDAFEEPACLTLLRMSAMSGQAAVCKLLLCNGANPDLLVGGYPATALMSAALEGWPAVVQVLLEAKADTSLRDFQGKTALDLAETGVGEGEGDQPAAAALLRQHAAMSQAAASPPPATAARPTDDLEAMQELEAMQRAATSLPAAAATVSEHVESLGATSADSVDCIDLATLRLELGQLDPLFGRRLGKCLLASVRIRSLTGRPELNGRLGKAVRYDLARNRYEVQVQGEVQSVMVRVTNLQLVGAGAELPEEIFLAAGNGDERAVTTWLAQGGQVDARCLEDGAQMWTMLHAAVVSKQTVMCKLLLLRLANLDLRELANQNTALIMAAAQGSSNIVNALLEAKADACLCDRAGRTALSRAEGLHMSNVAAMLRGHARRLEYPAFEGIRIPAHFKCVACSTESMFVFAPEPTDVHCSNPKCGAVLLEKADLYYVLQKTVATGDVCFAELFLEQGGDVDVRIQGRTMLMVAVGHSQLAACALLLQRGANPDLLDEFGGDGAFLLSPLMLAAGLGHVTIMQTLLDAKADASLRNAEGKTAFDFANANNHVAASFLLVQLLVQKHIAAAATAPPVKGSQAADDAAAFQSRRDFGDAAAAADRAAAELLAEEAAEAEAKAKKAGKKKKKKKKGPADAAASTVATAPSSTVATAPSVTAALAAASGEPPACPPPDLQRAARDAALDAVATPYVAHPAAGSWAAKAKVDREIWEAETAAAAAEAELEAVEAAVAAVAEADREAEQAAKLAAERLAVEWQLVGLEDAFEAVNVEQAAGLSGGGESSGSNAPAARLPDEYVCPITSEIMTDPVSTVRRRLTRSPHAHAHLHTALAASHADPSGRRSTASPTNEPSSLSGSRRTTPTLRRE